MMDKRIAVVTGAAGGIGRVIVESFVAHGYRVLAVDRVECCFDDPDVVVRMVDLCSESEIVEVFRFACEHWGGVHVLVNNASISHFSQPIDTISADAFRQVIDTNLVGSFLCCQQFVAANRGLGYGRIINIASTRFHQNEANWEAYGASKGGLVSLTNSLCVSLSDTPITVNAISPGWIECYDYAGLRAEDHRQHPSGRVGKPEDIARMVLFLAEQENDFINGANMIIDGGMTKRMIYPAD